jgi:hypothetical protein
VGSASNELIGAHTFPKAISWSWKSCYQSTKYTFGTEWTINYTQYMGATAEKEFFSSQITAVCFVLLLMWMKTRNHLFFRRPFGKPCWNYISPNWDPSSNEIQNIIASLCPCGFLSTWSSLLWLPRPFGLSIMISYSRVSRPCLWRFGAHYRCCLGHLDSEESSRRRLSY